MITVVYACNDAYARQTLVSMVSVFKHNSDAKIYLIMDELSGENQKLMVHTAVQYGQTVYLMDIKDVLPEMHLDNRDRHPRTIYAKLFLENMIEEERILYLDSDIVIDGNLEALFSRNMECELVAGVLMPYSAKMKTRVGTLPGEPYICDGVVLLNMKLWKQMNKADECRNYIEQWHGRPPMLSEGVLNHICQGMIGILEPKYNLMPSMLMYSLKQLKQLFRADFYYKSEMVMQEARLKPVAIHFMNELYNRPWFEPCNHPFRERYKIVADELFGENEMIKMPLASHTKITVFLKRYLPFAIFVKLYHIKNKE